MVTLLDGSIVVGLVKVLWLALVFFGMLTLTYKINGYVQNYCTASNNATMVEIINSIPIAMTMNPTIRESALIPDSPRFFTIIRETNNTTKVMSETKTTEDKSNFTSVKRSYC